MTDSQPPLQHNVSEQPPPSEDNIKAEPDLDASIEQEDVDMNPEQPDEPSAPGLDPLAPAPTPSKKETSLREFLGKMDDYAPIVSSSLALPAQSKKLTHPDPGRCHSPLSDPRRPPATRDRAGPNAAAPRPSARARCPKIYIRYRRRLVSVRSDPRLEQLLCQQRYRQSGSCIGSKCAGRCGARSWRRQGFQGGYPSWDSAAWVWRRGIWGIRTRTNGSHDGGSWYGSF